MSNGPIKYAVLGDIHANLEALSAVLADARNQGCTHYACVGDLIGYNANPRECLEMIRAMNIPCVKGNHDHYASTDHSLVGLSLRAGAAIEWTRRQLSEAEKHWLRELRYVRQVASFSIVHATLDGPEHWGYVFEKLGAAASFTYQNTSVCFYGHTHLPRAFIRDTVVYGGSYSSLKVEAGRKYFVNVGSVGEPRDGNPAAAYVIFDLSLGTICLQRVPYDASPTEEKNHLAGLPPRRKTGLGEPT
jgi:predicted phosphodiesterase